MKNVFCVALIVTLVGTIACSGARAPGAQHPASSQKPNANANVNVRINEVCASGSPDWIELVNLGDDDALLDNFTITDDKTQPKKATIPAGTVVASGDHVVLEISDATVGFKLASDEEVHIYDPNGAVVDEIDWNEGDSPANGSFARIPDGTGDFKAVTTSTQGAPND